MYQSTNQSHQPNPSANQGVGYNSTYNHIVLTKAHQFHYTDGLINQARQGTRPSPESESNPPDIIIQ
jgi:hypothetical protein